MAKKGLGKGLGAIFGEDVVKESKEETEKKAKATNHRLNVKSQNKMEPSRPPQVAATLKNVGNWELECAATYSNVKSSVAKE